MEKVVLATGNPHKVKEILPLLEELRFSVKLQTDFFNEEVEEDGLSFIENAIKKARFASQKTGLPAIADDSGLEVFYLNGEPGIYSARYASDGQSGYTSDSLNNEKLLQRLKGVPYKDRKACYFCAMAYVRSATDATPLISIGKWCGEILTEVRTSYGVGYDPIMWMPDYFKTAADIPLEIKNQVSHRAQALNGLIKKIERNRNDRT